jgi:putative endonuclease
MLYYAYIAQCSDNTYYCGYTTNIKKRESMHNKAKNGAKYTRTRRPVQIKYFEQYTSLSEALKRENQLKKLTHKQKADLVLK